MTDATIAKLSIQEASDAAIHHARAIELAIIGEAELSGFDETTLATLATRRPTYRTVGINRRHVQQKEVAKM